MLKNLTLYLLNYFRPQNFAKQLFFYLKEITFDIHDHSDGFDIREHPEPVIQEIIKSKRKGGVGLMLVKRIMDDIDFIKSRDDSIVRLTKFRS